MKSLWNTLCKNFCNTLYIKGSCSSTVYIKVGIGSISYRLVNYANASMSKVKRGWTTDYLAFFFSFWRKNKALYLPVVDRDDPENITCLCGNSLSYVIKHDKLVVFFLRKGFEKELYWILRTRMLLLIVFLF